MIQVDAMPWIGNLTGKKQPCVLSEISAENLIAMCCKQNIMNDDSASLLDDNAPVDLVMHSIVT
jgi:hypothetical protein